MACNGKCYLAKELATFSSSTHQHHQEKQHLPQIDLSKYPVAPLQVPFIIEGYVEAVSKLYWSYFQSAVQYEKESLFRPPILLEFIQAVLQPNSVVPLTHLHD